MASIQKIKTISEFHRTRHLPPPQHPLISVVNFADVRLSQEHQRNCWVYDFYSISLKRNIGGKIRYGQQEYDFDEGIMFFIAPGQVFSIERDADARQERSGWMLMIHPDFFWNTTLAKSIKHYEYFGYTIHEALFVSRKEEDTLKMIIDNIRQEYHANMDKYSQSIIIFSDRDPAQLLRAILQPAVPYPEEGKPSTARSTGRKTGGLF